MLYGGEINTLIKSLAEDKPNKSKKGFQIQSNKPLHDFVCNFKKEYKELHELIIFNNKQLCDKIHDNNKTPYEIIAVFVHIGFKLLKITHFT